jgi:hypothetical protein
MKMKNLKSILLSAVVLFLCLSAKQSFSQTNKAYGDQLKVVDSVFVSGSWQKIFAIYSGDINQDGGIDGNDMNYIDNEQLLGNFGYLLPDLNGDGGVDGNDMNFVDNNGTLGLFRARPSGD